MKKSLLALAVLGAFAGAAQAQTAVTVYGVVDAGLIRETGTVAGRAATGNTKLGSGISAGSRLGFRGTEDLGNGLSGIFVIENGFNVDDGTQGQGALFGRQAFVGLKSTSFGTVSLGRQQNLVRLALLDYDPFGLAYAGDSSNLLPVYGQRMNNSVKYASPVFGGFSAEVLYGFGEVAGNSDLGRQYEGSIGYTNGPIGVKFVHHTSRGTVVTPTSDSGAIARTNSLYGSYNFGVAKLMLGYGDNDGLTGPSTSNESRDILVGVSVPFGPNTIRASYIDKHDKQFDNDAQQYGISYDYALSKRTSFYTSYAHISNDNAANYAVLTGGSNGDSQFNVGVRHAF